MKTGAAFFIALRYLMGRAREGGRYLRGAAAGIALSLIPIVVTLIVADGMIRGITDRYLELGTGHIQVINHMFPRQSALAIPDIETLNNLRGVWQEAHGLGILVSTHASRGATIRAVERSFLEDEGSLKFLNVISGERTLGTGSEVLLGEELARQIGVEAGSTVRIMTIRNSTEGRFTPRLSTFTVSGIISSGYRELDSLWCIMSFEEGMRILPETTSVFLTLKINDPYKGIDQAVRSLYDRLDPGYSIFSWDMLQYAQYSSYRSTRQLLLFIMALIVIVAAVNVSSATSMLVIDRQKDIAVFKAGGSKPAFTSGIFLWSAMLTGLAGSVMGLSIGLVIGVNINAILHGLEMVLSFISGLFNSDPVTILSSGYYLETIPVIVDGIAILLIGVFTVLCSVLASWIPARRAGKLKPIEILRKY